MNAFLMWGFVLCRWSFGQARPPLGRMMEEAIPQCKMVRRGMIRDLRLSSDKSMIFPADIERAAGPAGLATTFNPGSGRDGPQRASGASAILGHHVRGWRLSGGR